MCKKFFDQDVADSITAMGRIKLLNLINSFKNTDFSSFMIPLTESQSLKAEMLWNRMIKVEEDKLLENSNG